MAQVRQFLQQCEERHIILYGHLIQDSLPITSGLFHQSGNTAERKQNYILNNQKRQQQQGTISYQPARHYGNTCSRSEY